MSNYEINILVNGNKCRQYKHNGKTYIESKIGSEYVIEVKNNNYNRVLSVISVDGLNVVTGKNQTIDKSPGYVLTGYNSTKIDGFRVSNESVAKFKFDYKNRHKSYAESKQNKAEKNVGIIALRIFNEKIKPVENPIVTAINNYYNNSNYSIPPYVGPLYPSTPVWGSGQSTAWSGNSGIIRYGNSSYTSNCINMSDNTFKNCSLDLKSSNSNAGLYSAEIKPRSVKTSKLMSSPTKGFDVGTTFGDAKESKVVEVEFERGHVVSSFDIYYASRESLIEMGIPLGNEKQINFPEPFKDSKYCSPPSDWNG